MGLFPLENLRVHIPGFKTKTAKTWQKFLFSFQVINFLTIHVPRPMSHIGQGRHRSWMLGNIFTHSPHNEHRYPGTTPEPPRNPGGTGHWSQLPCGPCALGVDFGSYWKLVSYLSCLHIRSKNAEKSPVEWLIYFEYGLSICHLSNPHKPYFFTTEWKCKKK